MRTTGTYPTGNFSSSPSGSGNSFHSHQNLRKLAADLKNALSTSDSDNIFAHAHHFRREMIDHIQNEENQHGLYTDIERRAPEQCERLAELRMQHAEILTNLEMIRDGSDESLEEVAGLIEECLKLVERHEANEEALLADLINQVERI